MICNRRVEICQGSIIQSQFLKSHMYHVSDTDQVWIPSRAVPASHPIHILLTPRQPSMLCQYYPATFVQSCIRQLKQMQATMPGLALSTMEWWSCHCSAKTGRHVRGHTSTLHLASPPCDRVCHSPIPSSARTDSGSGLGQANSIPSISHSSLLIVETIGKLSIADSAASIAQQHGLYTLYPSRIVFFHLDLTVIWLLARKWGPTLCQLVHFGSSSRQYLVQLVLTAAWTGIAEVRVWTSSSGTWEGA